MLRLHRLLEQLLLLSLRRLLELLDQKRLGLLLLMLRYSRIIELMRVWSDPCSMFDVRLWGFSSLWLLIISRDAILQWRIPRDFVRGELSSVYFFGFCHEFPQISHFILQVRIEIESKVFRSSQLQVVIIEGFLGDTDFVCYRLVVLRDAVCLVEILEVSPSTYHFQCVFDHSLLAFLADRFFSFEFIFLSTHFVFFTAGIRLLQLRLLS